MIKEKEEIDHAIWPLSSRDANDKTAIAVMLCILLFRFLNRGQPLIAALSAVFSLRQDLTTTLSFGEITSFRKFDWWGYCHHLLLHETIFPQ